MLYDPTYILVIISAIFCMITNIRVNSIFKKYAKVRSIQGLTGAEAAEKILYYAGLNDVKIEWVHGKLTDHYDPRNKILRLSDSTYTNTSVAAIGVAAHECGHAIQHAEGYSPLKLRSALVPAANIGSNLGIPIIMLGLLFGSNYALIQIGIWMFSLAVLFQLVTLPVEFNASNRAITILDTKGILNEKELNMSKKVLFAAAMTYVAAAASSIIQLLRLILLFGKRSSRN